MTSMWSSDLQVSTLDAISSLSLFLPPIYDMLFHVVDVVFSVLQSYNHYSKYPIPFTESLANSIVHLLSPEFAPRFKK